MLFEIRFHHAAVPRIRGEMLYRFRMRRHYIWYGLGAGWLIAALAGLLRHHSAQAAPAAVFAVVFLAVGIWIGKRDAAIRERRKSALR